MSVLGTRVRVCVQLCSCACVCACVQHACMCACVCVCVCTTDSVLLYEGVPVLFDASIATDRGTMVPDSAGACLAKLQRTALYAHWGGAYENAGRLPLLPHLFSCAFTCLYVRAAPSCTHCPFIPF